MNEVGVADVGQFDFADAGIEGQQVDVGKPRSPQGAHHLFIAVAGQPDLIGAGREAVGGLEARP
ncbi:hypothetical protein AB0M28_20375 [Streptomyces sp. NPDC051940]|uniref:hypothetical protein n=1 Tax=Streptomyces sp. NPDC051940 TaxID=3155675 RepID=UPI0034293E38